MEANRTLTMPFDFVVEGKTSGLDPHQVQKKLRVWKEAGATWWVEGLWEATEEQAAARLHQEPPQFD